MAERQPSRGLLSQLPPVWRALAILALAAMLIGGLYLLDTEGVEAAWRDQRLELVERFLNITVASGTIWAVLFEGDAILAAFARAFASHFAITFAFIADALKRAGMTAASIRSILSDMLARMPSGAAATAHAQFDDAMPEPSPPDIEPASPPQPKGPAEATRTAGPTRLPKEAPSALPWRRVGLIVGGCIAILASAYCIRRPSAPPAPPDPTDPVVEVVETDETWIIARGSVSQTLSECLGRQSWAELERLVAAANGII